MKLTGAAVRWNSQPRLVYCHGCSPCGESRRSRLCRQLYGSPGAVGVTAVNRVDRHDARASCNCSLQLQRRGSPSTRDFSRNHAGCRVSRLVSAVRPILAPFTRRVFNASNLQGLLCTLQLAGFCHSRLKGGSLQSTPHVSSDGVSRQQLNVTRNAAKWKQVSLTSTNAPENGQSLSLVSLDIKFLFSSHVEKLLGSIKVFEKAEQGG
jgi:hypothetical protein